jgi:hypothetical protein
MLSVFRENMNNSVNQNARMTNSADREKNSHLSRLNGSTTIDLAGKCMKAHHSSKNWRNDMLRNDRKLKNILIASLPLMVGILINGCATNAKTSSLIGAGLGAAVGQWIGDDTEGTLIGAGVGATAGYMIGNEADKEESRDNGEIPPTD